MRKTPRKYFTRNISKIDLNPASQSSRMRKSRIQIKDTSKAIKQRSQVNIRTKNTSWKKLSRKLKSIMKERKRIVINSSVITIQQMKVFPKRSILWTYLGKTHTELGLETMGKMGRWIEWSKVVFMKCNRKGYIECDFVSFSYFSWIDYE